MKTCEICGGEFEETRSNQKYCKVCGKNPKRVWQRLEKALLINKIHAGDLHKVRERTCKQCGKKFLTSYDDREFCSNSCASKYRIENATCKMCGKLLIESGNYTGHGYCNGTCREKYKLKKAVDRGNYIACEHCGKMFVRKSPSNRFCCMDCYKATIPKSVVKKEIKHIKKSTNVTEERICPVCKKKFTVTRSQMGKKFCSQECRLVAAENEKSKLKENIKNKLKLGKELNVCTVCKTFQKDCERFTSNFVYSPKGAIKKKINDKYVITFCPKFKG